MKALRICLMAVVAGAVLYASGAIVAAPSPALAQLPPGWTPGTIYQNVSNNPTANPAASVMPHRRPTDPPNVGPSPATSIWAGWTNSGWQVQPPSPSEYNATGQYCEDASGGTIWVPAGAPTDELTCPAPDSGS